MLRPLETNSLVGEPEGSDDYTEVHFDDEQILRQHNTAHVTPPPLAYIPRPPALATMEPLDTFLIGDEVICTIIERENDEFIKSSDDDLVPILKESELTLDSTDLESSMPIDPPLPCNDVLGDAIVVIYLLLGEHLDTLSTGDREINFNLIRDIEELERLLADDPVPVPIPRVFDEPLGHSDSISRSFNEFEDISSLDPPESTLVIDESSLLVTPPPTSKQLSLREVERFDPFFSLTQSDEETWVIETPSFSFHHMPSPRPAAYLPKEVMYFYYHPHIATGDGFDPGTKILPPPPLATTTCCLPPSLLNTTTPVASMVLKISHQVKVKDHKGDEKLRNSQAREKQKSEIAGRIVEGHANDEEIKLAYRRFAKYYHPDGNDVAFVIYDGSGSVAKEKNARVGSYFREVLQRRELMPLRRVFKDDKMKHVEDGDKHKEIEGMTKQTNAPLGKITIFRACNTITTLLLLEYFRLESELSGAKDCQSMVRLTGQVEESIHKAYYSFIEKVEHFIYIKMAGTSLPCKDQMAAALAASSIPFRQSDPLYANKLLSTATRGFGYADTYSGAYLQAGLNVLPSTTRMDSKRMKLDGAQINQTTLRIAQDWKHLLGGQKVVNGIEADKGREQVLGIKR
ncbi:NAC domain-containing protein [Tanacetum coccineum]